MLSLRPGPTEATTLPRTGDRSANGNSAKRLPTKLSCNYSGCGNRYANFGAYRCHIATPKPFADSTGTPAHTRRRRMRHLTIPIVLWGVASALSLTSAILTDSTMPECLT